MTDRSRCCWTAGNDSRNLMNTTPRDLSVLRSLIGALTLLGLIFVPGRALAQQRPLATEDPEPIGAGRLLLEGGVDVAHNQEYPVSGLKGNLWRIPTIGISVGISSIAELQIDGGLYNKLTISERRMAPLSNLLTIG